MGDILLSLPALHALRRRFQPSILTLAGNAEYLDAACAQVADRIVSLERLPLHRLHAGRRPPADDVALWRSYDRILSWTGAASVDFRRSLQKIHPAALVAPWRPIAGETRHVSRIFLESLRPWLKPEDIAAMPEAGLLPSDPEAGRAWLRLAGWGESSSLVVLHAGAGGEEKRWGADRYLEVGRALLKSPHTLLLLVEGPAEAGIAGELAGRLASDRVIPAVRLPLQLLASVIHNARAFLGNDSGIAHLAAGLGVPALVLFGPTSPRLWAPLGRQVSVLESEDGSMDGIRAMEVMDGLRNALFCGQGRQGTAAGGTSGLLSVPEPGI